MVRYELASLGDPLLYGTAQFLMSSGQGEGAIPAERAALTGGEDAIFAYVDTPAGKDTVIGGAVFYQPEGTALLFLDILFVAKPYRRRGVATELINRVTGQARARGLSQVQFGTLSSNAAMQALGRRCGFGRPVVFMVQEVTAE